MRLFRIEHGKRGHGPYFDSDNTGLNAAYTQLGLGIPCAWTTDGQQPTPQADSRLSAWWQQLNPSIQQEYKFAFASREQMEAWVDSPHVLSLLREWGYVFAEYECEDRFVRLGTKQACFNGHRARRVCVSAL